MTTPADEPEAAADETDRQLGRSVARRWRLGGSGAGLRTSPAVGTSTHGLRMFAASGGRVPGTPVAPDEAGAAAEPPNGPQAAFEFWRAQERTAADAEEQEQQVLDQAQSRRSLRSANRVLPNNEARSPGRVSGVIAPKEVKVARLRDVAAVGKLPAQPKLNANSPAPPSVSPTAAASPAAGSAAEAARRGGEDDDKEDHTPAEAAAAAEPAAVQSQQAAAGPAVTNQQAEPATTPGTPGPSGPSGPLAQDGPTADPEPEVNPLQAQEPAVAPGPTSPGPTPQAENVTAALAQPSANAEEVDKGADDKGDGDKSDGNGDDGAWVEDDDDDPLAERQKNRQEKRRQQREKERAERQKERDAERAKRQKEREQRQKAREQERRAKEKHKSQLSKKTTAWLRIGKDGKFSVALNRSVLGLYASQKLGLDLDDPSYRGARVNVDAPSAEDPSDKSLIKLIDEAGDPADLRKELSDKDAERVAGLLSISDYGSADDDTDDPDDDEPDDDVEDEAEDDEDEDEDDENDDDTDDDLDDGDTDFDDTGGSAGVGDTSDNAADDRVDDGDEDSTAVDTVPDSAPPAPPRPLKAVAAAATAATAAATTSALLASDDDEHDVQDAGDDGAWDEDESDPLAERQQKRQAKRQAEREKQKQEREKERAKRQKERDKKKQERDKERAAKEKHKSQLSKKTTAWLRIGKDGKFSVALNRSVLGLYASQKLGMDVDDPSYRGAQVSVDAPDADDPSDKSFIKLIDEAGTPADLRKDLSDSDAERVARLLAISDFSSEDDDTDDDEDEQDDDLDVADEDEDDDDDLAGEDEDDDLAGEDDGGAGVDDEAGTDADDDDADDDDADSGADSGADTDGSASTKPAAAAATTAALAETAAEGPTDGAQTKRTLGSAPEESAPASRPAPPSTQFVAALKSGAAGTALETSAAGSGERSPFTPLRRATDSGGGRGSKSDSRNEKMRSREEQKQQREQQKQQREKEKHKRDKERAKTQLNKKLVTWLKIGKDGKVSVTIGTSPLGLWAARKLGISARDPEYRGETVTLAAPSAEDPADKKFIAYVDAASDLAALQQELSPDAAKQFAKTVIKDEFGVGDDEDEDATAQPESGVAAEDDAGAEHDAGAEDVAGADDAATDDDAGTDSDSDDEDLGLPDLFSDDLDKIDYQEVEAPKPPRPTSTDSDDDEDLGLPDLFSDGLDKIEYQKLDEVAPHPLLKDTADDTPDLDLAALFDESPAAPTLQPEPAAAGVTTLRRASVATLAASIAMPELLTVKRAKGRMGTAKPLASSRAAAASLDTAGASATATASASTSAALGAPTQDLAAPELAPMPDIVRTSQGPRSVQELIAFWEREASGSDASRFAEAAAPAAGPAAAFASVFGGDTADTEPADTGSALTDGAVVGGALEAPAAADAGELLAGLPRAMTVAPPPISVSPERSGDVIDGDGPPIPASAYPALAPGRLGSVSAGSSSTGQTGNQDNGFAALALSVLGPQQPRTGPPPPLPAPPGGQLMSPDTPTPSTRRSAERVGQQQPYPFAEFAQGTQAERLDALVDRVIERIEERVVDELERRGRRHNRGVF